jgi:hypothetical protein
MQKEVTILLKTLTSRATSLPCLSPSSNNTQHIVAHTRFINIFFLMIYLAEPHAAGLTTTGYVLHAARMGLSGI